MKGLFDISKILKEIRELIGVKGASKAWKW